MAREFTCVDCGKTKPVTKPGATGYVIRATDNNLNKLAGKICFACCAINDWQVMQAKGHSKNLPLYLSSNNNGRWEVSNWPGTLRFKVAEYRQGRHNWAGTRTDVWFIDRAGRQWHGVQIGENTQVCHCKRLKSVA